MKRLGGRVNIIPIVAKSDTMTVEELQRFKQRVMEDIKKYNLKVYQFSTEADDDDETAEANQKFQKMMPFAVVSSNDAVELNGGRVRVRQYPWGRVEVDNPSHCDVLALESALFKYVSLKD
jgi:septin family protein